MGQLEVQNLTRSVNKERFLWLENQIQLLEQKNAVLMRQIDERVEDVD